MPTVKQPGSLPSMQRDASRRFCYHGAMRRAAVLTGVLLALSSTARAEVFHDGQVMQPGTFSLGFEGEAQFDPGTNILTYAHLGIGLPSSIDFGAKVSFFDSQRTYFGGDVQWGLLDDGDGYPALSFYAGAHFVDLSEKQETADYWGLDGGVTISETVQDMPIYFGYDIDVNFPPEEARPFYYQRVYGGIRIVISEHLSFFIEGGLGLDDDRRRAGQATRNYISGGPTLYF